MTITHEQLLQVLHYNPITGIFTWKVGKRGTLVGSRAGHQHKAKTYRHLSVNGKSYMEHRLAYFYYYGVWPKDKIDHIDHDKTNNAINNLREANTCENNSNVKMTKRNTSGYKGVSWSKKRSKWKCVVGHKKRYYCIGFYTCPIEAAKAYDSKAIELHGDYAVTNASLGLI